jgi:hypothetical protein
MDTKEQTIEQALHHFDKEHAKRHPEPSQWVWGRDYGKDILSDLNQFAHWRGTNAICRDVSQRAFKEISRSRGEIERLRAEVTDLHTVNLEANRLWRALNGHDIDDFDKRAEMVMRQTLDGMMIGPTNRNGVKAMLAEHFEQIAKDAVSAYQQSTNTEK